MLGRDVLISWIWNIPCSSQKTKDFRREIIWDFFWSIWDFFAIFCQPSRYRTWFQASSGNSDSSNWPGFEADVNPRALWEKLGKKNVKGRNPFNQNFRKFRSKLNGSVRSNRDSFEKTGPPFEVDHFSQSDRLEYRLNGSIAPLVTRREKENTQRLLRERKFASINQRTKSRRTGRFSWGHRYTAGYR